MDGTYDESLSENPFFKELKNEYTNLLEHSISEACIICIPRVGCFNSPIFTVEDFCAHILVPSIELPETHYNTLTEKQVTVLNNVITIEVPNGLPIQSHILFEEKFYTKDYLKYQVWCIEKPLDVATTIKSPSFIATCQLSTINDCINLLWTQAAGRQVLDEIEFCVQDFLSKNLPLPVALAPLKDLICALFTQCLQISLQNRRLREISKTCKQSFENLKIAVETYMQSLIFDTLFKALCTCCSYEDSHLNKRIRNLADLQLRDFEIRKDLYHNIPRAKQVLSDLNTFKTVLEKVMCLKQAINSLKSMDNSNKVALLAADDMLPAFVFLVVKSNLPNWFSQLTFIKEFRFGVISRRDNDEYGFLITTLDAVVQHIQSDAMTGPPQPEAHYYESDIMDNLPEGTTKRRSSLTESMSTNGTNSNEETLDYIFELIKSSNNDLVKAILVRNNKHLASIKLDESRIASDNTLFTDEEYDDDSDTSIYPKLCHPLCICKICCQRVSRRLLKTFPTVTSRDSHGLTPLHIASIHGKVVIMETLLDLGAEMNSTDLNECTSLHHAAARGHQNALLLLLHSGAQIYCLNIDKNTALHMAANNGHINCVKALIYFAEHSRKNLNINSSNEYGNTPLHLASKWGYEGIARLLIEHGAKPTIKNRYKKTAFDCAHNLRIMKVLKSCPPSVYEYIHLIDSEGNFIKMPKIEFEGLNSQDSGNLCETVENLKRIDRILQAISYGDTKLACFYLNINYSEYLSRSQANGHTCHPLCECVHCKKGFGTSSDVNVNLCDANGSTALHYAAQFGLDEMCRILFHYKADINSLNKKGQTPLHLAAAFNKIQIIKLLLENGAKLNNADSFGNTAIHEASNSGHIAAIKMLLSYKPNLKITNCAGKTALDIAKEKVHLTIIDLLGNRSHTSGDNLKLRDLMA